MIYVGSQYFRAPTPPEADWDRDIEQARHYGLDYVRFWLMWNWYCRAEGEFDFSSLRRLLDTCQRHGMKALMLVNLESVPAWLVRKHPEAIYVDSDDGLYRPESVGNTPAGGFPGLCFHNRPVVEAGKDYIRALVSEFADHPAVECWEPHNEPMFEAGRYNDSIYCYCDASVAAFRDYLRDRYGDVETLNADWRRNYGCFEEVEPPRRRGMYNDWIDLRLFHLESLIETLRWRVGTIRENDPDHYVMIHTRGGSGVTRNLAKEGIDDYRMAELVDKYGTAAFPQCGPEHEYFLAMAGARCAARGKEFWMAELQSGPYGMGVHRSDAEPACEYCGSSTMEGTIDLTPGGFDPGQVTAERLAMWSWSGIAQGGKGVMYWQYRNESFGLEYGFGLTKLDGSAHPRLEAVKRFKHKLTRYGELFEQAEPLPTEVAIAWDPRNDIVNWTAVGCTDAVKNSIKGIHLALWHTDYPVDVLRLDTEVVDEDFGRYRVIYLPFSPFISSASAGKLREFVEGGGTLVAEASAAQFDDTMGVCPVVPGQGLDELFGCRRVEVRTMPARLMPRLTVEGHTMAARMHKEVLQPGGDGAVIGEFTSGEPAVVSNQVGQGRAIYIGTNPFMAYREEPDAAARRWVVALNEGVRRAAWTDAPGVVARAMQSGERRLVFLLNTMDAEVSVTLHVAWDGPLPAAREILVQKAARFSSAAEGLEIREDLPSYGTRIYVLEAARS